ncbi:MAG: membrane protein insertion efficiency factor YidD [Planctomycetota bacterium]
MNHTTAKHPRPTPRWRRPIDAVGRWSIVIAVGVYRGTLGPFMGGQCRYHPTCSQYMLDSVARYGPWLGAYRGIRRILRCHPWAAGGHDPA